MNATSVLRVLRLLSAIAISVSVVVPGALPALSAPAGPSFSCANATRFAERTVCHDPELSALDRQLALVYQNMTGQGGVDAKALRSAEDAWLKNVRDACTTAGCINAAYVARTAALTQQSSLAASPAAYADTRPYAVPPASLAGARALIGKSCATGYEDPRTFPGFVKPAGLPADVLPVIVRDFAIVARQRGSARFAFLLHAKNADVPGCRIADVVALPPAAQAEVDLQCAPDGAQTFGFGVGHGPGHDLVAFWSIETNDRGAFLAREPIHVLGLNSIRCQQPESGE